jgi:hypothetical protein
VGQASTPAAGLQTRPFSPTTYGGFSTLRLTIRIVQTQLAGPAWTPGGAIRPFRSFQ